MNCNKFGESHFLNLVKVSVQFVQDLDISISINLSYFVFIAIEQMFVFCILVHGIYMLAFNIFNSDQFVALNFFIEFFKATETAFGL